MDEEVEICGRYRDVVQAQTRSLGLTQAARTANCNQMNLQSLDTLISFSIVYVDAIVLKALSLSLPMTSEHIPAPIPLKRHKKTHLLAPGRGSFVDQ